MKRSLKLSAIVASVVAVLCVVGIYALFHGYFDHGRFDVKQVQWSSSGKLAILAERSDNQALGGLTFFVVTGSHLLSPNELKHEYHSDAVIFAATTTCLDLHWQGPSRLIVECHGSYLNPEFIDTEKTHSAEIAVNYVNISLDTAKTFSPK
jgi:hypothetical protein